MIKDKLKAIHPRHVFQFAVLILTLAIGLQFYLYVRQAQTAAPITIQRPPGVEGFLPIGALMGWKRFLLTGDWDTVHPAAMVILGWAVLLSFLLRKTFCGWFCPVGTVSEWCWRLGERLFGRNVHFFKWLDIPLRSLKYVLLGLFVWVIGGMTADQIAAFINSPYYRISDAKMLQFFTQMTALTAVVLLVLLTLSVFIKNFWCRYLCPYGALLGIFSAISPTRIQRNEITCTHCQRCDRACPSRLPVSKKEFIRSPECTGCMTCVQACPQRDTLALATKGISPRYWTPRKVAVAITLFFLLTVYTATITGHWRSSVSDQEFKVRLKTIDSFRHP